MHDAFTGNCVLFHVCVLITEIVTLKISRQSAAEWGFEFPKECFLDLLFECVRTTEKMCGLIITSTFHKR